MNILLPVFATVVTILLWAAWSNQSPDEEHEKPKDGSFRVVRSTGEDKFYVERYSSFPTWHRWSGPFVSAKEAQDEVDSMTGPFIEVIPPTKPTP